MELIYSVALLGACVITATIIYLGSRMPVTPWWANDTLVANFWCILIVGLVAVGVGFLIQYAFLWEERTLGAREIVTLSMIVIGYALVWTAIGPRKRLARYTRAKSMTGDGVVLPMGGGSVSAAVAPPHDRVPPKAA